MLTLGGLTIAIGRVIDDSIVVIENIYRHLQEGDNIRRAAYTGTREVAGAITASTLTTVAVFLPLGFVHGLASEFFRPFALTVTFALLCSLAVALHGRAGRLDLGALQAAGRAPRREGAHRPAERLSAGAQAGPLDHKIVTLVAAVAVFAGDDDARARCSRPTCSTAPGRTR